MMTPTDRLLTGSLLVAPLVYLAADATYAARGWEDPAAGVLHVLGAIGYGLVILRVADWLPRESWLAAGLLFTGVVGLVGNAAYGFETIHVSLGDTQLVDQPGAANLIKPIGLFFPVSFPLFALALGRLGHRWQAAAVLVGIALWPVAHIGNVAPAAVVANVLLAVAFRSLVLERRGAPGPALATAPREEVWREYRAGSGEYSGVQQLAIGQFRQARHSVRASRCVAHECQAPKRASRLGSQPAGGMTRPHENRAVDEDHRLRWRIFAGGVACKGRHFRKQLWEVT